MWALFFLSALVICGWFIYDIYVDVNSYPFKTVSSMNMTSPLSFPAVTICNKNPMDITKLPPPIDEQYRAYLLNFYGLAGGKD